MSDYYKSELEAQKAKLVRKGEKMIERGVRTAEDREKFEDLKAEIRSINARIATADAPDHRGGSGGNTEEDRAFTRYLRTGDTSGVRLITSNEYRDGTGFTTAPNDAGVSPGSTGYSAGYMIPQGFWQNLQIAMKAYGGIAQDFKQVETESGAPMPWPTIDPTAVTATILGASSELTQLSVANPYQIGQGMLNAWTFVTDPVLVSLQLVNDSAFEIDNLMSSLLGQAIGREFASVAVSGTGSGQPLGVVTAINGKGAWSAGSSGGYVSLTAATSVKTFASSSPTELSGNLLSPQTLINMVQAVDPAYYPTCKWYMNSTQAWNTRGIVDSEGRPILSFMNGFNADDVKNPNYNSGSAVAQIFGFPVVIDNNIPSLTASTTGGPLFGALDHAMVQRTVKQAAVMRLTERYADYLAVGYIGWVRLDARSNDMRAVTTVKPAAT
jgi:HK97 family phage major capsid protein